MLLFPCFSLYLYLYYVPSSQFLNNIVITFCAQPSPPSIKVVPLRSSPGSSGQRLRLRRDHRDPPTWRLDKECCSLKKALSTMAILKFLLSSLAFFSTYGHSLGYFITIDAHGEECFHDTVNSGTKMGLIFEVAEGGFLDIDVKVSAVITSCSCRYDQHGFPECILPFEAAMSCLHAPAQSHVCMLVYTEPWSVCSFYTSSIYRICLWC